MSRTESLKRAGFFACPPEGLARITALLIPGGGDGVIKVLDPCAGEGEALERLCQALRAEGYAAELQRERAAVCREKFEHALWADAFRLHLSHDAFSLLLLNPPYDNQGATAGTYELSFLREFERALVPGGVLIYLVPQDRLAVAASYLSGHYERIRVYRFPEGEFEEYRQVAVIAVKRRSYQPDEYGRGHLARIGKGMERPDELPPVELARVSGYRTVVPVVSKWREVLFGSAEVDADWLLGKLNGKESTWAKSSVEERLWPRALYRARPLMPLRHGHLALLLAAGYLDNAIIPTPDGDLLVKGVIRKERVVTFWDPESGKKVEREALRASLNVLNVSTGELKSCRGEEVGQFVRQYREPLRDAVVRTFPSLYTMAHRSELPVHFLARRPLGGQGDVARAVALSLRTHRGTLLAGQPGVGKSYLAVAASSARLYGAARTFIQCPPHLVKKWAREVQKATPWARAVIIRKPADLDAVMRLPVSRERPLYVICSRERAKLGYRQRPTYVERRQPGNKWKQLCCPDCFAPLVNKYGIPLMPRDLEGHRVKCLCRGCRDAGAHDQSCTACCGTVLQSADRSGPRRHEIARYLAKRYRARFDLFIADEVHELAAGGSAQGRASGVIAAACKRALGLSGSIYKGYASSMFYLLYRYFPEFRREFAYTDVTRFTERYGLFEFVTYQKSDGGPGGDLEAETGVVSKRGGEREQRKEKPGMSPAMLLHVIECTAFMRLEDLRQALPPYREDVVVVDMDDDQATAYRELEQEYERVYKEADWKRKLPIAGARLQDCMSYPDTCTEALARDLALDSGGETVEHLSAPTLPGERTYPKERTLVQMLEAQRRRGRRSMVFYENTHARDLGPRLLGLIRGHGFRAELLRSTVPAEDREEWIERRVREGVEVLITNPALIETGLDMIPFPGVFWAQISFRTERVWQGSHRPLRPGQTEDCEVYFLVYRGTKQYPALKLIADKVHKANVFGGDLIGNGLDLEAEADTTEALAREFLECTEGHQEGLEEMFQQREDEFQAGEEYLDDSFADEDWSAESTYELSSLDTAEHLGGALSLVQISFGSLMSAETTDELVQQEAELRAKSLERKKWLGQVRRARLQRAGQLALL